MRTDKTMAWDATGVVVGYAVMTAILHYILNAPFDPRLGIVHWWQHPDEAPMYLWGATGGGIVVAMLWWWFNPFDRTPGEYGDARFANKKEAKKMNLLDDQGIILGTAFGTYIRSNEPLSTLLLAPPGTGKTAGIAIPTLMSCGNSMVINDVKGELFELTSKRRGTFSKILRFSPSESGSSRWNPLAAETMPDSWNDKVVKVERLASTLYPYDANNHWMTEAKPVFIFFALYLIHKNGGTSIPEVRSFSLSADDDIQVFIAELMDELGDEIPLRIKEEGNGLVAKADKEFGGVFSTFKSQLNAFADPYVAEALSGNDFDFRDFRKECHSVYLVVKAEDVDRLAPILRLFFEELALYILSNAPEKDDLTITMLLDEMTRLGKLQQVLNMPALSRGNRGNAILIAQDFAQIEELYGKNGPDILLGTTAYTVVLAQRNQKSAKLISESIGNMTRTKESNSVQAMQIAGSTSKSAEGHALLSDQALMSMDVEDVYIIAQNYGNRPVKGKQARWYKDKNMKNLAGRYEG